MLKIDNQHKPVYIGVLLFLISFVAFSIRLFSVIKFESVIHEFDPWFNYRATKYLVDNGWVKFLDWFDETVWYPLGRPVGKTVYPGIMVTSSFLYNLLVKYMNFPINIRDLCVFLAPIFSGLTCLATFGLGVELKDSGAGLLAAGLIAICPGYISRSVAGSYDNEGISIFLMLATFYFWLRALRKGSVFEAIAAATFYYYLAASWGGYVFVINLIPLHVFTLLLMKRFTFNLYIAYSIFYVFGTIASMTVHFVKFQPVSTAEHLAAMGMFCLVQVFAMVEVVKRLVNNDRDFQKLTRGFILLAVALMCLIIFGFWVTGNIGAWTGRFYALWDTGYAKKHIPIIASVSEHQPTTWSSFFFDLHILLFLAPAGLYYCFNNMNDGNVFAIIYTITASYFAGVMIRLILTLTPILCILGGVALSFLLDNYNVNSSSIRTTLGKLLVLMSVGVMLLHYIFHCTWSTKAAYSSPSIVLQSFTREGDVRIIDDFRESYEWLRQNTRKDAKILSWWDYGYQIAGMSERTTIVDNNTWNNTHIALVGKILGSSERDAYPLLKELEVDYILVLNGILSGFSGDDINKFLWMIRIAEGIFPEIRESDFLTPNGDFRIDEHATLAMKNSILYKTVYHGISDFMGPNASDRLRGMSLRNVDPKLETLEEAFSTENLILRIFKVKNVI